MSRAKGAQLMSDPAFFQLWREQAQLVRHLVDNLVAQDHAAASYRSTLANVVNGLVRLLPPIRELYDSTWKQLIDQTLEDEEIAGSILRSTLETLDREFEQIAPFVADARESIGDAEEFDRAAADIRRLKAELLKEWPWLDQQAMAAARTAYERGDWQEAGDIVREMEGSNS